VLLKFWSNRDAGVIVCGCGRGCALFVCAVLDK